MKRILLLMLLLSCIKSHSRAQCNGRYLTDVFPTVNVTRDIPFGKSVTSDGDTLILTMDVYTPAGDVETKRPLMLWAHGGSFLNGDKNESEATLPCIAMAKKGYVTASINYRLESNPLSLLSAETMIKAVIRSVQDYKAAVRYFRKDVTLNGNTFGIDTTLIILGGDSAGGIAALQTVYMDDTAELELQYRKLLGPIGGLEGNSGNPGYSSLAAAVVEVSGAVRDINYMNNNTNIPVFCCHHDIDFTIPYGAGNPYLIPSLPVVYGSQYINFQAKKLGMYHDLYTVPGVGHLPYVSDTGVVQPVFDSMMTKMARFLYRMMDCNPDHIVLAVHSSELQKAISIYPNPSSGFVHIDWTGLAPNDQASKVVLYDLYGEKMMEESFTPGSGSELHAEQLPKGMYILQVLNKNGDIEGMHKLSIQ